MTHSMNNLPVDAPERNAMVTVTAAPNTYMSYPAYGELHILEYDINGRAFKYNFRQYRADGRFAASVWLGHAAEINFTMGFLPGAKMANTPSWAK